MYRMVAWGATAAILTYQYLLAGEFVCGQFCQVSAYEQRAFMGRCALHYIFPCYDSLKAVRGGRQLDASPVEFSPSGVGLQSPRFYSYISSCEGDLECDLPFANEALQRPRRLVATVNGTAIQNA